MRARVARTRKHELGVGILLLVAMALLAWMALQVGAIGSWTPQVRVDLRIGHAAGVQVGAVVAVSGVPVGKVEALTLDHDAAIARLAIDTSAGIRRDVAARVRARSLLGEKYIEFTPRSRDAALLVDGDTLEVVAEQLEIDEMVQALGPMFDAYDGASLAEVLSTLTTALAEDPERLGRMLARADVLLDEGATAAQALPELMAHADATLSRVDRAVGALERRLDQVAGPLHKADALLDELQEAAVPLDDLVGEARGTLSRADGLLAGLDGLDGEVRDLLTRLQGIDKWEIRRLLREEGILIRIRPHEVVPTDNE